VINFRYHIVSLTAVFLSLAVGLVLGSTVLNGPMLDALNSQISTLGQTNQQLREQVSFLEDEAGREETFALEAAPLLLDGALTGRLVTVVVLPDADDYATALVGTLELAGAEVAGTVRVTDRFVQPGQRLNQLLDLAHHARPPSVPADELPANSDGVETSAALLAKALFTRALSEADLAVDPDGPDAELPPSGLPEEDRRRVLSAYAAADYLEFDQLPSAPAELVVVVAALPFTDSDAGDKNDAMLTMVQQFDREGAVVLAAAGPSGDGNLVNEVRSEPDLAERISTVDNVSTPQGLVATGLVIAAQLAGQVGHYGDGGGAQALLPARIR
jgi:hypothetical protein